MTSVPSDQLLQQAKTAWQAGDADETRKLLSTIVSQYPGDAAAQNSAGSLFQHMGDPVSAEACFAAAAKLMPTAIEIAINHAISLSTLNRHPHAIDALRRHEEAGSKSALFCSTMGTAQRGAGFKANAASWYTRALALEPARPKALHGRARVALERGEPDALARFKHALSVNQSDPDLWLGMAQSLDVNGDTAGARSIAEQLVQQAPHWDEGLRFLAQLRLAAGESDFTSHYGDAAKRVPQDPNIYSEWSGILSGLDYHKEAAEIVAKAAAAFPQIEHFRFLEANYAGAAGDNDRAERLYASLSLSGPERCLHEARHRIRRGEYDRADALLDQTLADNPWSIAAWALRGVVWRLTENPKANWLHEQAELVQLMPLEDPGHIIADVIPVLHHLHDSSPLPLGQSLRGGSQTRAHLFDRTEAEILDLEQAIRATVEQFRQSLPAVDLSHPLLRHRAMPWTLAGSWSVRLIGGGDYHTSHIHPQGLVSSALYLELPEDDAEDPQAGWLEIGRPPPDLQVDLEPLRTIQPEKGHMALFPSTLYHGTRPFSGARRMTVAFDVIV